MKLKIAVLFSILCFLQLITAGTLTENKKNGKYPHIEWYSAQIGGGYPLVLNKRKHSGEIFNSMMNFVKLDNDFFTIKWKHAFFTPVELTLNIFMLGFSGSMRGGFRVPIKTSSEFRLGVKGGGTILVFALPCFEVSPYFAILYSKRLGGGHVGAGFDFPIAFPVYGDPEFGIFFYLKFGY
jgi:hypothetical protein